MSYKKDQKLDNSKFIDEQKALEEAETIAKLAPNEKTRNEAKDVVEKLTESVEGKSTLQDQQEEELDKVLDETKKNINKTTNEAKREVSQFAKAIGDLQEQTIQTTKAIGYELVRSSKGSNLYPIGVLALYRTILCLILDTMDIAKDNE